MKANVSIAIIISFLFQSILLLKPLHPETNKDSSTLTSHFIDNDTIAIAIQRINERIDREIEKQTTDRLYILVVSFFAAFAACVSACVAFMLLRNAKLQKRITLFEKRFQIYDLIRRTMIGAKPGGRTLINGSGFPTYIDFSRGTMDKELFFAKDTCKEIDKIETVLHRMYCNAISLEYEIGLKNIAKIDALSEEQKKHSEVIKEWIEGESSKLMILFKDYLEFRDP